MTVANINSTINARDIPPLTRDETERIAHDELAIFLNLLEQLDDGDWEQPTHCDLWTVRDVVAHQGGHVPGGRGAFGMFAQLNPRVLRPYQKRGMNTLDAMNQAQVDMRREWPLEKLLAEIREGTRQAIASRRGMWWPSKLVRVPAPDYGMIPVDYLLHVVFPRDMWIHRLDITDATGRSFETKPEHDGVLIAHVVRDMERNVKKGVPGHAVRLTVDGPAGGTWRLGKGDEIAVTMDVPTFLRASSSRISPEERRAAVDVSTADEALREKVLASLVAVY